MLNLEVNYMYGKVKKMRYFLILFLAITPAAAYSGGDSSVPSREEGDLVIANAAVRLRIMVAVNPESRYLCTQNKYACLGADQAELGLSLIAARDSKKSLSALVELNRYAVDGHLSSDLSCAIINKGDLVREYLYDIDSEELHSKCVNEVKFDSRSGKFKDLNVNDVCSKPEDIDVKVGNLITEIKKGEVCNE